MSTYSDVIGHGSMIFDHLRNSAYEKAIQSKVTVDSVVLDLGAGLGLHGLMAAKAGARKVYLVDPSPAIFAAEQVAKANGLDNVVCIQSTAEDLQLDEKVDLIISVFTGNFLLTEDLLPSLFVARDTWLKKGGSLIPERGRMWVMPVTTANYYQENIGRWSDQSAGSLLEHFGVNYSSIRRYADNSLFYDNFTRLDWTALADQKMLVEIDFHSADKAECFATVEAAVNEPGLLQGWLGWFDMLLADTWLSTSPQIESLHWSQVFLPAPQQTTVEIGENLCLDIKRPEYGDWTWRCSVESSAENSAENLEESSVGNPAKAQTSQSTFLSRPMKAADIQKQSPAYRPILSEHAQILKFVLSCFDGNMTSQQVAADLVDLFPAKFPNKEKAERYVQIQAKVFS